MSARVLPDPRDSYQVLESLALRLGGEFRRHGDDFSIPDDDGPETVKTRDQQPISDSVFTPSLVENTHQMPRGGFLLQPPGQRSPCPTRLHTMQVLVL